MSFPPTNVCLIGFMGTGKTAIGKILAEKLGFELIDTDELIAAQAGKSISEIFQEYGEASFRRLERGILDYLSRVSGKVISTGGGMPAGEGNLEKLKKIGPVICLEASPEEIFQRVKDCRERPLLQVDNPLAEIKELLEARKPYYEKAGFIVHSRTGRFDEVSQTIMEWLKEIPEVRVELGRRSYRIRIGRDLIFRLGEYLAQSEESRKVMVITDKTVGKLYGARVIGSLKKAGFHTSSATVPDGEPSKSYKWLIHLHDRLIEEKLERSSLIVALGGGVVGDLAGFAAATYLRGIPFVQVPTSLLAQVDSSVGGKVAIDHPRGKNLIGAFYQPIGVYIDIEVLKTLPERELANGLTEVIKYGIIEDETFFSYLEKNWESVKNREYNFLERIIRRSCEIKAEVVSQDETESGRRAILNYGHTIGHAIESLAEYRGIAHGEAVAVGMAYAATLSERMGLCDRETKERQWALLKRNGLGDTRIVIDPEAVIDAVSRDKKVLGNRPRFVLTEKIGGVTITDKVSRDLLLEVLKKPPVDGV